MKALKTIAILLLVAIMVFGVVACNPKTPTPGPGPVTGNLTPDSIKKLDPITNFGSSPRHYNGDTVTYGDTSAEVAKLAARIEEKKVDAAKEDASSIIKIFAASDAELIIEAMRTANLPEDKMKKTVDYMAGQESVSEDQIQQIVDTDGFDKNKTAGWSFFDDWSYYDKLKKKADKTNNTNDEDNVKRQYRNILGKVFAIDMSGDQFARLAVHELVYGTSVVEGMAAKAGVANAKLQTEDNLTDFDKYCQRELDYETLVYLRAFNEYYNNGANSGLQNSVELYGYYYVYNRTDYESQSDEEFEKQLKYGHMSVFTEAEWLEYVKLQRNSYVKAYRYSDDFYTTFYQKHFGFQEKIERHEEIVYDIDKWYLMTYTGEMRKAIQDKGLNGQLNFTDWLWCYAGDDAVMKDYNAANTANENGKDERASAEQKYAGEFQYDIANLKMINYILKNMENINLGRTLKFQVYGYSGEMVKSAQSYKKDKALVEANKIQPDEAIGIIAGLNAADQKTYAAGKIDAILKQMYATYSGVSVNEKANSAASQPWDAMQSEVQAALDKDYSTYATSKEKVDALEDMVIKRVYSCGGTEDNCPNNTRGHVGCTKEYDTKHKISQFVSNYEVILRHMAGSAKIEFMNDSQTNNNDYAIKEWPTSGIEFKYECGFHSSDYSGRQVSHDMLALVKRTIVKEISMDAGKSFGQYIDELAKGNSDRTWWESKASGYSNSVASKDDVKSVSETTTSNKTGNYSYTYVFAGWFLDEDLIYMFDENDKISCDLKLYAGYNVTKKGL